MATYPCTFPGCSQCYDTAGKLRKHSVKHGPKTICCDWPECDAKFHYPEDFKRHYTTHTKEYPFTCDDCQRGFVKEAGLLKHVCGYGDKAKEKRQAEEDGTAPKKRVRRPNGTHCLGCVKKPECKNRPTHSLSGEKPATHCAPCMEGTGKAVNEKYCQCGQVACCGIPGEEAVACAKHRLAGHTNNPTRECLVCDEWAIFGPTTTNNKHCLEHAPDEALCTVARACTNCLQVTFDVDPVSQHCIPCQGLSKYCVGCMRDHFGDRAKCKEAYYAGPGATKPTLCGLHKKEGDVGVVPPHKQCETDDCTQPAIRGNIGEQPRWCTAHVPAEMNTVNLQVVRCTQCEFRPACFATSKTGPPVLCAECKNEESVDEKESADSDGEQESEEEAEERGGASAVKYYDVRKRTGRCMHPECVAKGPAAPGRRFGPAGGSAMFCQKHKLPDHINVKHRTCDHCHVVGTDARKCLVNNRKFMVCNSCAATHYAANWIYKHDNYCDTCLATDGRSRAAWGLLGQEPNHCLEHAVPGDIKDPKDKCIMKGCRKFAVWGIPTEKRQHCEVHHIPGECSYTVTKCGKCGLEDILNRDGLCFSTCDPNGRTSYIKRAEYVVRDYFLEQGLVFTTHNKTVLEKLCGLERPDFMFECKDKQGRVTHYVLVEVDEHQHETEMQECHIARMKNISYALSKEHLDAQGRGCPVVWIRFNPNEFYTLETEKSKYPMSRRLLTLGTAVHTAILKKPTVMAVAKYLYFGRKHGSSHAVHLEEKILISYEM